MIYYEKCQIITMLKILAEKVLKTEVSISENNETPYISLSEAAKRRELSMEVKYGLGYQDYEDMINNDIFCEEAFIFEFKVFDKDDGEEKLEDTVANALVQIEEKSMRRDLLLTGMFMKTLESMVLLFVGKNV